MPHKTTGELWMSYFLVFAVGGIAGFFVSSALTNSTFVSDASTSAGSNEASRQTRPNATASPSMVDEKVRLRKLAAAQGSPIRIVISRPEPAGEGWFGMDGVSHREVYVETVRFKPRRFDGTAIYSALIADLLRDGERPGYNALGVPVLVPRYVDWPR